MRVTLCWDLVDAASQVGDNDEVVRVPHQYVHRDDNADALDEDEDADDRQNLMDPASGQGIFIGEGQHGQLYALGNAFSMRRARAYWTHARARFSGQDPFTVDSDATADMPPPPRVATTGDNELDALLSQIHKLDQDIGDDEDDDDHEADDLDPDALKQSRSSKLKVPPAKTAPLAQGFETAIWLALATPSVREVGPDAADPANVDGSVATWPSWVHRARSGKGLVLWPIHRKSHPLPSRTDLPLSQGMNHQYSQINLLAQHNVHPPALCILLPHHISCQCVRVSCPTFTHYVLTTACVV
jgi:hypothetical protein